jgi:uncharacterized protein (DUF849 family)
VTGAGAIGPNSGAVPITPKQIASEAILAAKAGASIVHLHVRDPETGAPSMEFELYRQVVEDIRSSGCGVLINLTMGPGARIFPGAQDPLAFGPGTNFKAAKIRAEHVVALKPEICTLDIATMNFHNYVMVNTPPHLVEMAEAVREVGTKVEAEIFDLGGIWLAHEMIEAGILVEPMFQLCLGIKYGAGADAATLVHMKSMLPAGSAWAAFSISQKSFPTVGLSYLCGGHVRVGMEDNLYLGRGVLARSNAELVERAKRIIEELGGQIASPSDARQILKIGENVG